MEEINKLAKATYFKLKQTSKEVWVRGDYNRTTKRYSAFAFDDICKFREFKKGRLVFTDFEF